MGKGKFRVCKVCGLQNDTVNVDNLCYACQKLNKTEQAETKADNEAPATKSAPISSLTGGSKKKTAKRGKK